MKDFDFDFFELEDPICEDVGGDVNINYLVQTYDENYNEAFKRAGLDFTVDDFLETDNSADLYVNRYGKDKMTLELTLCVNDKYLPDIDIPLTKSEKAKLLALSDYDYDTEMKQLKENDDIEPPKEDFKSDVPTDVPKPTGIPSYTKDSTNRNEYERD